MRLMRTLMNIDTKAEYQISVFVQACIGGFTYHMVIDESSPVFPTADAAADAYAQDAQRRYDRQIAQDRTRTPPRYRCEECGASLHRPYCPGCRDSEFIVEIRTGRSLPAPVTQDGLNEDHYGHG